MPGFPRNEKMPTVKTIHFYVNEGKPRAGEVRRELAAAAAALGIREAVDGKADAVLVLGGDGTMLRAVHRFPGVPVIGFNLGGLGYLASVGEDDFGRALEMLAAGAFKVARRSALAIRKFRSGDTKGDFETVALNDVVVMRGMSGHAAVIDLAVDEKRASRYLADGIVIATPTGSTAYSLSAGGPVLMPDSGSIVVTPMNPHALGVRALVVGDEALLAVSAHPRTDGESGMIGVYADGENVFTLEKGEILEVSKSPDGVAMIELEGHDPYEVLARKLGWSGTCMPGCGREELR